MQRQRFIIDRFAAERVKRIIEAEHFHLVRVISRYDEMIREQIAER